MAEKIVSPGVFTKENDLSFLQQGVADIGAAFIGPFKEGPLVPTIVNSQAEFQQLFGSVDDTYYTPLAVQNYLREAGTATICRVAGKTGYTEKAPLLLIAASGSQSGALGLLFNTSASVNAGFTGTTVSDLNGSGDFYDLFQIFFEDNNDTNFKLYVVQRGEDMRMDLVSQSIYNNTKYVDFLCNLNRILNPFHP